MYYSRLKNKNYLIEENPPAPSDYSRERQRSVQVEYCTSTYLSVVCCKMKFDGHSPRSCNATHLLLALIGSHNKEIGNPPTPGTVRSEMLPCVLISNLMRKIPARAKSLIEITSPSPSSSPILYSARMEGSRTFQKMSCTSYHRVFQFRNATQRNATCMHSPRSVQYVLIAIEVSIKKDLL
ncbi:uncharacterized protein RSE6_03326 [Rhynchosporium secalis]|uniref:Uncharacterized protein n=1 Tax=Rhynchosporium secalis TaxID=38038 RepID=A0A1E1M2H7_RHYSE|nr:uncharacterized protein RSE6_03326 [Rhynchosporium secalis]